MKKLAVILALLLALCGCAQTAEETPEPTPTPLPSFENPSGIYADWTKLKKEERPDEIGSRLTEGPLEELIPSDDYGTLIPFIGNVVAADHEGLFVDREYRYGLVTESGCVVLDPVLSGVYTTKTDDGFVYVLDKNVGQGENMHSASAICASDGSWCTDFIYSGVYWNGEYIRAYSNDDPNEAALLDHNGNIVLQVGSLSYEEQLSSNYDDYDGWLLQYSSMNYCAGYVNLELADGRSAYFDMEGKILRSDEFDGYAHSHYVFSDEGVAPVRIEPNGFYGLLNNKGEWILPPDNGQDYYEVQVHNGGFMLRGKEGMLTAFDGSGNVICNEAGLSDLEVPEMCRLKNGWCISAWENETNVIYDLELNIIARPRKDTLADCYTGYALAITELAGKSGLMIYDGAEKVFIPGEFTYYVSSGDYVGASDEEHLAKLYDVKGNFIMEHTMKDHAFGVSTDRITGQPFLTVWENSGNYIVFPDGTKIYDAIGEIRNGYYMVMDETGAGVKNKDGEYIFRKNIDLTD